MSKRGATSAVAPGKKTKMETSIVDITTRHCGSYVLTESIMVEELYWRDAIYN